MSENSQNTYGGQALIEGVMIRGKKTAVMSVRSPEGEIIRKEIKFSRFYKPQFLKIPIIRGILNLIDYHLREPIQPYVQHHDTGRPF